MPDPVSYWNANLDPQNLERGNAIALEDEIAFALTPDLLEARRWLTTGATPPSFIVDLGAGLGAFAFALARLGHFVLAVDSSPARLLGLRARARQAGCADRISCVAAVAEALPFAGGSIPALYTRSVLIHAELARAAAELARVLPSGGRFALIEPTTANPFVILYRRLLAPSAWREITHYFTPPMQRLLGQAPGGPWHVRPFYFLGFLAFIFQFARPNLTLFRLSLALLTPVDRLLFLLPPLRRLAWFGVIEAEKKRQSNDERRLR